MIIRVANPIYDSVSATLRAESATGPYTRKVAAAGIVGKRN